MKIENYGMSQRITSDYFVNITFSLDWTAMKCSKFRLKCIRLTDETEP